MNAIQVHEQKTAAHSQAVANIAAMRAKYVEGTGSYEAITEAERNAEALRAEAEATNAAAEEERRRISAANREKAEAEAKAAVDATIAVELRRLHELEPVTMIGADEQDDVETIAKIVTRLGVSLARQAKRAAAVQNERAALEAKIASAREGRPVEPSHVRPDQIASETIGKLGRVLDAALQDLVAAFPDARNLLITHCIAAGHMVDAETRSGVRFNLGLERAPSKKEIAEHEAAKEAARVAAENASKMSLALSSAQNDAVDRGGPRSLTRPSAELQALEGKNIAAQEALRIANEQVVALEADLRVRRRLTPKL
jgi:hypothetical protein